MKKLLLIGLAILATFIVRAEQVSVTWESNTDWTTSSDEKTISYTYQGINITMNKGEGGSKPLVSSSALDARAYANNTVQVTNEAGNMTKIVFNVSKNGVKRLAEITSSVGTTVVDSINKMVIWEGNTNDVTFTVGSKNDYGTEDNGTKAGQLCYNSVDVTAAAVVAVAAPTFSTQSGTYYESVSVGLTCLTEGASIYYTLDGTTPDATKTAYTAPFELTETTTVKAIAIKGSDVSTVSECTYTIKPILNVPSIAAFLATNNTEAAKDDMYRITCPVKVTYQYGKYLFLTDDTTSLQVYGTLNKEYKNGDVLTGICGSVGYYRGAYQMTPDTATFGAAAAGDSILPKTVLIKDITRDMLGEYIKIEGVTMQSAKMFADSTDSIAGYAQFDVELPNVDENVYTVEGIVGIYNTTLQVLPTKITLEEGDEPVEPEIIDVASIAAFLATNDTEEAKDDMYRITCPVKVTYQYGKYLFLTDDTTSLQVYGTLNKEYKNGDVLTGICGSVGYYRGAYQMTPDTATFGAAAAGDSILPKTVLIKDITRDMLGEYIKIEGVTMQSAKMFADSTDSIAGYAQFDVELPIVNENVYTVEGIVGIYNTTIQVLPTKITLEEGDEPVEPEIIDVASIAAFLATNDTAAPKEDKYRITCPVTVVYQYGKYLYITDGTTFVQVFGTLNNKYQNGDVLTGICGSVGYYNGTYQMTPDASTFGTATAGTAVAPEVVKVEDITADMVSQYIKIENVTIETENKFTDATGTVAAYKRFDVEIPAVSNDIYTVEGFVNIYKTTIQVFPTLVTKTDSGVEGVEANNNLVYAHNGYIKTTAINESVQVYNVTGKLVATDMSGRDIKVDNKGIYIVKVGNKATKVVVR